MSVRYCSRKNCDGIMCDRYSSAYGYICNECFMELCSLSPEANIETFMDSNKKHNREKAAYARFDAEFPMDD